MRAAVIINRAGGTYQSLGDRGSAESLQKLFRSHGMEADIQLLDPEKITDAVRRALREKVDRIVAGGGDGTLSSVAHEMAGQAIPLAVLPLGTLNHFAHDLRIPEKLEEAIEVAAKGQPETIDLGSVNGQTFINNSSVGLYPQAVAHRDRERERRGWGKGRAMFVAMWRVLRQWPVMHLQLEIDGERIHRRTPFVFIGNNEYSGNVMADEKRPSLNNGELCLLLSTCNGLACLVRLTFQALLGRLHLSRDFESRVVRAVTIESRRRRMRVARDGEIQWMDLPLRYQVKPGSLQVIGGPEKES